MGKISYVIQFLTTDIWRVRVKHLSKVKSFGIQTLRIILLAFRGFTEDKCQLRASALTYYTLLSIVPILAMAFGVAKGFGFEKLLETHLIERIPGQEEVISQMIGFAQTFLEKTKGGVIAGIGIAILFWTVVKVLGNIEKSFNDIWGIKTSRPIGRKFSDYLSMMLICPILLVMSSSATVLIASHVRFVVSEVEFLGFFAPLILTSLKILPFVVLWVLFTFLYMFMPNTKVQFKAGILGGIVAGTIYQIVQWAYITFQIGASKYGAIYGSFAALPLFLVWLQMSWLVVLFGAEVSFAKQNVETYEFEPDCLKASHSFKRLVALRITQLCVKNFHEGSAPWTAAKISHALEMPIRLVHQILFELTEAGVLIEVKKPKETVGYQPARDIEVYTIRNVIDMLDHYGIADIPVAASKEIERISSSLQGLAKALTESPHNVNLKNI